jgi:AraC-like DNA-binding protein
MGVGERDLSQALNHSLRRHFFDFINQARIEHAQALIADDLDRRKTLLDIAYASGFNSKSSFNTAFKKHAGQTPSAYRAAQRAS